MSSPHALSRVLLYVTLMVCASVGSGCAGLRTPRIDPTGERILIWPPKQVPYGATAPGSLAPGNLFSGNVQVPPVLTDPYFPQPALTQPAPPQTPGVQAVPALGSPPGTTVYGLSGAVDKLTITPERIRAPVGSEVLLRAGICTAEGYLLASQRIDWMLSADGAGQFVALGGRGWLESPLLPWNRPHKRDNHYATGYTASATICITRGTADRSDDVEVRRGDAWISVTSAAPGTSHVTAFAPGIESWHHRKAFATIDWIGVEQWNGTTPYLSPPEDQTKTIPTYPIPSEIPKPIEQAPVIPTPPPVPVRRPVLELEVLGESTAQIGGQIRFQVVIRNRGDAEATGIVMHARFDPGFSHLMDTRGEHEIEHKTVGNLVPGQSRTLPLNFSVNRAGTLCHDVTVTCQEGGRDQSRTCVKGVAPPPQLQPGLEVLKDGPIQSSVGESALFVVVVKNSGPVPLTNVQIVDEYDRAFEPHPKGEGYQIIDGRIVWNIPRLDVGKSVRLEIDCKCLQPSRSAYGLVLVTADSDTPTGSIQAAERHHVEILLDEEPPAGGASAAPTAEGGPLRLSIMAYNNPVRAGSTATYRIDIQNASNAAEEQVKLLVRFPPELVPDLNSIQAKVRLRMVEGVLQFEPIATLRPNESFEFIIPVKVTQVGTVSIEATLTSKQMPQGVRKVEKIEILAGY